MPKKRQYTDEEKAGTLAVLAGLDGNIAETARRLGISETTVRSWRNGTGISEAVALNAQEKTSALADLFEAMARESLRLADIVKADATYTQLLSGAALAADKMRSLREQATPTHGGTTQTIIVQYADINPAAPARGARQIVDEARRWNVVCCGRRFGKSRLGIDRIVGPALEGYPVAWFSPNYKMLAEMWRETKLVLLPITKTKSEQEHRLDLTTGGVIDFWSLDDPNSARGRKYKRIVIDEAAHIRELEEAVQKVLRPTLSDYRGDAWFLSTPKGRNFFWECFQRGLDPEEYDWACWQMPTSANPFIHPDEIADARRELPASIFSQEYLAEFLEVGGRYFDEFDPQKHLILDRDIPKHWHTFGGLDFGSAAPFSFHLCAADEQGGVDVYGECYESGLLPEAQAQRVCALLAARGVGRASTLIAADPSMFPPTDPAKRLGEYPIEAFWRLGLNCVPAVNNRIAGWTRVKEFLHRPGGLRIHKGSCPNLARTIPLMTPDSSNPEDLDTTLEDHACLASETMVVTQRGSVPIEQITLSDFVLTRFGFRRVLWTGITKQNAPVLNVHFSNGTILTATPDHPVFVIGKGFTKISEICPYDTVFTALEESQVQPHVVSVTPGESQDVYNLKVEHIPEFFANGVLVHNCDSLRYSLMTRPRPSGPDPAIPIPKPPKIFVDEFALVATPDLFE